MDYVSHPADPFHWHKQNYAHGHDKFVTILREHFLIGLAPPERRAPG